VAWGLNPQARGLRSSHPWKCRIWSLHRGGAMNLINWPTTIILRWLALAFSLGAWAGIALVVLTSLG
jgi:hypothetical protein